MKKLMFTLLLVLTSSAFAYNNEYPVGPDPRLTPGKLCDKPSSYRYPEKIAYCERDVTYETKGELIKTYDQVLGYRIENLERSSFKIDHYIPLCAGGSNDVSNLWPQHKRIYDVTDPIEPLICTKMSEGKLTQANAIKLITRVKNNLKQARDVMNFLNSLK